MKTFRTVLAMLLVALMLAGCGAKQENNQTPSQTNSTEQTNSTTDAPEQIPEEVPPTTEPATPVTLKVWTPAQDQDGEGSWLGKMEEEFQLLHPEYSITWENAVCTESDAGALASLEPEAAADVYMFANDQIGALLKAGAISGLDGEFEAQVKNDNSQTMINTVTYTDGKIYGFPVTSQTWFMYYNKDVFTQEDVKSLDTMLEKGKVAFFWGTPWYSGTFFLAGGGQIFGEAGNDLAAGIQFGEANGGYEAALKMVELAKNKNFVEDSGGEGMAGLIDGSIGAYFNGAWDYAQLHSKLGDKLGVAVLPTVEIGGQQKQMKSFVTSKAVGVNPGAENLELATEFAAFLASVDAQKARYEMHGVTPAAMALVNDPAVSANPVAVAEINTVTNTAVAQSALPEMSRYWTAVGQFVRMVTDGKVKTGNYKSLVDDMMKDLNGSGA